MSLLLVPSLPASAADILEQVPRDAIGFVVVRNLAKIEADAAKLLGHVGMRSPGGLELLRSVTGIGEGVDTSGDLMIAMFISSQDSDQYYPMIWLQVKDYDALVSSLSGDPGREVAGVTVAGEDLLVARRNDWAVLAGPDQRDRLERLDIPGPAPRFRTPPWKAADWGPWINENDVTMVFLQRGLVPARKWAELGAGSKPSPGAWPVARQRLQAFVAQTLQMVPWTQPAKSAAIGLRMDEAGNALIRMRMRPFEYAKSMDPPNHGFSPPQIYQGGEFVAYGYGTASAPWTVVLVRPYVESTCRMLKTEFGIDVDYPVVEQFTIAVSRLVRDVEVFSLLVLPGDDEGGVQSNRFLAVRAESADALRTQLEEAVRLWNELLPNVEGGVNLSLEKKETTIAGRPGVEYSLDLQNALGGPDLPELRTALAELVGDDMRLQLQYVKVDDETAVFAVASEKQVAALLPTVADRDAFAAANFKELDGVNKLLPASAEWRLFVSPSEVSTVIADEMHAMLGDAFGGPLVREFPPSLPIAVTGGCDEDTGIAWLEAVIPLETLSKAGEFIRAK